ncbi:MULTISPECIES: DUF4230 domain-containing protein [Aneurinibacillus]|uniref:DUF4230 domain-containing protein n=1 Tax=Aneurinibacillus thermoaerophilus TaxID=143495 RepID=A0A1G8CNL2_ANETH|nr:MULTISPECIES: DUF4230 domain-containing protein [Aneurinibacillus]AMA71907.1 hypothetical protein ACH33_03000 [Aneurinibacillus sp. XH2]MED0675545.1 DUF4230 domain-containing protein [Aneurinibacillus thermoaerophilus]MED0680312.1 DUF4230 domain-containing protein [Aneurinibacillus thermoaerophilus]MED0737061.1 DUF4230 domain-containing protein [Aneurinibacillus thermoaerophilus]MED0757369.1 DUF4230 domain-containing protein [Aneurinibacillus thermoaerophilus]
MNNKDEILQRTRDSVNERGGATVYRLPYAEKEPEQKGRFRLKFPLLQWLNKWKKIVAFFVLGCIIIGSGIWAGSGMFGASRVTSQTVVQEIQELSYLTTAEVVMMTTLEGEDAYRFYNIELPGTKRFFHIDVPAKILVGIDLKKVTPSDIRIDETNKQITITLPRADFLQAPNIDINKVKVFTDEGIFREKMTPEEQREFLIRAQDKLRQEAVGSGVLRTAEDRAVRVLQQIYKPVGYQVNVAFK